MTFDLLRADTICALATGSAPAALAVIRVAGPAADVVRARVFAPRRGVQRPFVATRGSVFDERGTIDDALCVSFPVGKSYTGEAAFELSLHGGPVATRATLAALLRAGCRIAEPGEFTLRAVLAGRMTLEAAEAVDDVVEARTDAALRAAQRALHGGIAQSLDAPRAHVVDVLAEIEARLDFPDEDIGEARTQALLGVLDDAERALAALIATAARGDRLRRGARVVLFGAPNAGKSTLLNALLGAERALVHHEPGTTRDVLEGALELGGVEVTLVDVAGVRALEAAGAVEQQGIRRALAERAHADLVLVLTPSDAPHAAPLADPLDDPLIPTLQVVTKVDLGPAPPGTLGVCAPTGVGLDALKHAICAQVAGVHARPDEVVLMRERHVRAVHDARAAVVRARDALSTGAPQELAASELRSGIAALDRLLGRDVSADVLDAIFSRFCIGK